MSLYTSINNVGEYYSSHYLNSTFSNDIKDDRILFTSPGLIYGNLTIADLERDDYVSSIRNNLLAEAFYLMGEIEKYGTGFVHTRQWLKDYPEVGYEISEMGNYFRIEDAQKQANDLINDLMARRGLSDNQAEILLVLAENPFLPRQQMAARIGITPRNIRNDMEKLKQKGLLERDG